MNQEWNPNELLIFTCVHPPLIHPVIHLCTQLSNPPAHLDKQPSCLLTTRTTYSAPTSLLTHLPSHHQQDPLWGCISGVEHSWGFELDLKVSSVMYRSERQGSCSHLFSKCIWSMVTESLLHALPFPRQEVGLLTSWSLLSGEGDKSKQVNKWLLMWQIPLCAELPQGDPC